jgi:thymidine phosphorylase
MLLGAGRETVDSRIDPAVGVVLHKKVGDLVVVGEPLMTVHVNDRGRLDLALDLLRKSVSIGPEAPPAVPLVREVIDGD